MAPLSSLLLFGVCPSISLAHCSPLLYALPSSKKEHPHSRLFCFLLFCLKALSLVNVFLRTGFLLLKNLRLPSPSPWAPVLFCNVVHISFSLLLTCWVAVFYLYLSPLLLTENSWKRAESSLPLYFQHVLYTR